MIRQLVQFPAEVWVVSVAVLLNRSVGFLTLFSAVYFHRFPQGTAGLAAILILTGTAGVIGSLVGGKLAERTSPRSVLAVGSLINVPLLAALALCTENLTASVVLATLSVAVTQSFVAPSLTVVTESEYAGPTVTVVAFFRIFLNVGSIVAPLIFALLGPQRFPLLFLLSAAGSSVVVVLVLVGASRSTSGAKTSPRPDESTASPSGPTDAARVRLWTVVAVLAVTIAIYAQHQSGIPLSVTRLPEGDRLYAILLLINPLIIVLGELPLSALVAKFRWNIAYGAGVLATAVGLAVCGLATSWWLCIVGFVIFSIGEAVFAPLASSTIAHLARPGTNARYQGYVSVGQSMGMAIGPGVGAWGVLTDRPTFWVAVVVVGVLSAGAAVAAGVRTPPESELQRKEQARALAS